MNCPHCGKEIEQINMFGYPMTIVANAAVPQGTLVFSNLNTAACACQVPFIAQQGTLYRDITGCAVPNIGTYIKF